jgi:hypothetical protein
VSEELTSVQGTAIYCHTCAAVFVVYGADMLAASRDHALDEHAPARPDDTFTQLGPTSAKAPS